MTLVGLIKATNVMKVGRAKSDFIHVHVVVAVMIMARMVAKE